MTPREKNIAYFLSGMGVMALLFVLLEGPTPAETLNEQCGRSIAVAQALQAFIEEQHGVRFHTSDSDDFSSIYRRPVAVGAALDGARLESAGWPQPRQD